MSPNGRRRRTHSQVWFAGRANRRSRSAAMWRQARHHPLLQCR
ncbi:hypothetical protein C4K25_4031 [Pseudomonas chlororaphis]|nr:hypothetical protein C4K25_4031 [Pseudomonas chlororaphis]